MTTAETIEVYRTGSGAHRVRTAPAAGPRALAYRAAPGGAFRCRLDDAVLDGTHTPAPGGLLAFAAATRDDVPQTLDGYLDPADGRVDALWVRGTRVVRLRWYAEERPVPAAQPVPAPRIDPIPAELFRPPYATRRLVAEFTPLRLTGRWTRLDGGGTIDVPASASGRHDWPSGFLRHVVAADLGTGLTGPDGDVISAIRPEPAEPAAIGRSERVAFRLFAQDVALAGHLAQARPLMHAAARLFDDRDDVHEQLSLLLLLTHRTRAALALADYRELLEHLTTATALRARLAAAPVVLDHLRRIAKDGADTVAFHAELIGGYADALDTAASGQPALAAPFGALSGLLRRAGSALDDAAGTLRDVLAGASRPSVAAAEVAALIGAADAALGRAADAGGAAEARALPIPDAPAALLAARDALLDASPAHDPAALDTAFDEALRCADDVPRETRGLLRITAETAVLLHGGAAAAGHHRRQLHRTPIARTAATERADGVRSAVALSDYVSTWRATLIADADRLAAMDEALPFFERLTGALLDLGAPEDALLAAERARARALADLLGGGPAPDPELTSLRAAVSLLDGVVVEYFLTGDRLAIWVIGGDGVHAVVTPFDAAAAEAATDRCRQLVESAADDAELTALLRALGRALWDPIPAEVLPADPDTPVWVVPHLFLARVPFAGLLDDAGRHLVQRHAPVVLPSLALVPALAARRSPPQPAPALVGLVAPDLSGHPGLPPLRRTAELFDTIAGFYSGPTTVHTGPDATVAALRGVPPATTVYLATHADVPGDPGADPLDAFVALAPAPGHDGRLTVRDVLELTIDARLVVLGACRTGAGPVGADGVLGLSRAFLTAGPAALLTTLTEVGELTSLELLHRFHTEWLVEGRPMPAALRRAQDAFRVEHRGAACRWAPFVLFGAAS